MSKDIEEAIERLKQRIKDNEDYKTTQVWLTDDITEVKTVLNYIETLEKENKELNEIKDKKLDKYLHKNQWICKNLAENYIHKSIIEEKIEELDEELEIMKVDAMYGRYKKYGSKLSFEKQFSYKYGMHDVLQDLLENK